MSSEKIDNIIFDIGGVILHVDFMPAIEALADESRLEPDHVMREIFASPELKDYDRGRIGPEDFFRALRTRLKVAMDAQKMRRLWDDIFRENTPVADVIRAWHGTRPMFLISNTCQSHVEQFEKQFDLFGLFKDRVYSCDVGLLKPDAEIYRLAIRKFGVEPSRTLFIDDKPENVDGAREAGLQAIHFKRHEEFLEKVRSLGMLTL